MALPTPCSFEREPERLLMAITGGVMTMAGLLSRSRRGSLLALAGGLLAYRAAAGHNDVRSLLTCCDRSAGETDRRLNAVDEALDESFPASDPPSWTSSGAHVDD